MHHTHSIPPPNGRLGEKIPRLSLIKAHGPSLSSWAGLPCHYGP